METLKKHSFRKLRREVGPSEQVSLISISNSKKKK
jgi:hypothetical protein